MLTLEHLGHICNLATSLPGFKASTCFRHGTAQLSTAQHSTAQPSPAQHSTTLGNTLTRFQGKHRLCRLPELTLECLNRQRLDDFLPAIDRFDCIGHDGAGWPFNHGLGLGSRAGECMLLHMCCILHALQKQEEIHIILIFVLYCNYIVLYCMYGCIYII